ncbi:hypothetical protein [Planosporangium mesophilum]|uniref:DUF4367 domain-containing protein n=1 Tax=Planosporangium mesophilum TaxID=689768 RepID=A0A8J3TA32_9ACTN|nr:hypothetical protein [Planosporangium mesophilum]NJC85643.1 hypothetical protein [Planosporangium mesophilum]GII21461.1 hypothetical protein Pme01_10580 [Planosporangium mesophilum]
MAEPRRDGPVDLAAELRALGGWLDTPEPPDLRPAVRARLTADEPRVRRLPSFRPLPGVRWLPSLRRRWLVAAAALLVALTLAVLPPGRAAVAHAVTGLLRFAGIEVHRGQPSVGPTPNPTPSPLPSIRSAALDEARRQARFPVLVPARLGVPGEVLLADPAGDGAPRVVSLVYRGGVRLDEFDGRLEPGFVKSMAGPQTEWYEVAGRPALWLPDPHVLEYVDRQGVRHTETRRLAAATLVWTDGTVSYRLEGAPSAAEALAIARTLA